MAKTHVSASNNLTLVAALLAVLYVSALVSCRESVPLEHVELLKLPPE